MYGHATSESDDDGSDDASSTTSASSSTNLRAIASYRKHERDGADAALRSVMDSALSMVDDALSGV